MKGLTQQELREWALSECAEWYMSDIEKTIKEVSDDVMEGGTLSGAPGETERMTMRQVSYVNGLKEAVSRMKELRDESGSDWGEDYPEQEGG